MESTQPILTPNRIFKPTIRQSQKLNFNKIETFRKLNQRNHATTKYCIQLTDASALQSLILNLKDLSHITSLSLDLSSVKSFTPKNLKFLSIVLKNFNKLTSLDITFPDSVEISPNYMNCLGFAFQRLRTLKNLSFKFSPEMPLKFPSLKPFAKLLRKLTRLRSLDLSHFAWIASLAMTFLPSVFEKLTSLENLNLNFAHMGSCQSKFLSKVFLALKRQKKPFKNLSLNFKDCAVDFPNSDPICQGLAMFDLSQLQTFKFHLPPNSTSKNIQKLIATLQASPLKRLTLDFSTDKVSPSPHWIHWIPPQASKFSFNLQNFQSLSDLHLNPGNLENGILGVGSAIKPLINLKSLSINFSEQIHYHYDGSHQRLMNMIDIKELVEFSAGLKDLQNLKHFSLNLKNLENTSEETFQAVSAGLQCLTGLSSLNLGLAKMKLNPNKRMTSVCEALAKLTKLTDLSLDFSENEDFDPEDLDILAVTISDLSSLKSVNLNFKDCVSLGQQSESFDCLFKSLGWLKCLRKIALEIPCIKENMSFIDYSLCNIHVGDQKIHRNLVQKLVTVPKKKDSQAYYAFC